MSDEVEDMVVEGPDVGTEDEDELWYKEGEEPGGAEDPEDIDRVPDGELRAATLASAARREAAAEAEVDQAKAEQRAARAHVPPDKSGATIWAQVSDDSMWHGYSRYGPYAMVSYCGIEHHGPKRRGAPPRGDVVCEKCAAACGFTRRRARMVHGRQRGSRRLGSIVDRMEVAVEGAEAALARLEALAGV